MLLFVVVVDVFFFCFFVVPIGLMTTPPIMSSSGSIHSHLTGHRNLLHTSVVGASAAPGLTMTEWS